MEHFLQFVYKVLLLEFLVLMTGSFRPANAAETLNGLNTWSEFYLLNLIENWDLRFVRLHWTQVSSFKMTITHPQSRQSFANYLPRKKWLKMFTAWPNWIVWPSNFCRCFGSITSGSAFDERKYTMLLCFTWNARVIFIKCTQTHWIDSNKTQLPTATPPTMQHTTN